jgi:hypothetical protein
MMGRWHDGIAVSIHTRFLRWCARGDPFYVAGAGRGYPSGNNRTGPAQDANDDTGQASSTNWNAPDAVKKMAAWALGSGDNRGLPFVIVDKSEAKVFAFGKSGTMLGATWALIGLARGDDNVPGIGTMPLRKITPDMRTTPAGRFVAAIGYNLGKKEVLWVDYPTAYRSIASSTPTGPSADWSGSYRRSRPSTGYPMAVSTCRPSSSTMWCVRHSKTRTALSTYCRK